MNYKTIFISFLLLFVITSGCGNEEKNLNESAAEKELNDIYELERM